MKRIKYEIDGVKVPSLNTILDNCKIGGIGNLLYRAHQAGVAGRELQSKTGDTTNTGWCALNQIKAILIGSTPKFDINEYSDNCIDRAYEAVADFVKWKTDNNVTISTKDLTLVSEKLKFCDTFNTYTIDETETCLIDIVMQNEVYPENLIKLAARAHLLDINGITFGGRGFIIRINNPKDPEDPVLFNLHEYEELIYPRQVLERMIKIYDDQLTLKTLV